MSKVLCYLRLGEIPLHLYQVIAGFILLNRHGVIDLKIEKLRKGHPDCLPYNMMEVIVNEKIRILYDVNDGYDNLLKGNQSYVEFMDDLLAGYDLCFKRSYSPIYNSKLANKEKIHPLGLNYMVTIPKNIAHQPMPNDPLKEKVKKVIRKLPFSEYYNGLYNVHSFEELPQKSADCKIIFMARLWDVGGDFPGQLTSVKRDERIFINEMRAECIRLCKKEFGYRFFGGVNDTPYANQYYSDIVIQDKNCTKRNYYLKRVKDSDICIATMGLHESIGWKFAEYLAASKAIVTEKLHYEVPGDFYEGQNYLVFHTPTECVNQINKLINDEHARYKMMVSNFEYYQKFVKPDQLVLNSLTSALEHPARREVV